MSSSPSNILTELVLEAPFQADWTSVSAVTNEQITGDYLLLVFVTGIGVGTGAVISPVLKFELRSSS